MHIQKLLTLFLAITFLTTCKKEGITDANTGPTYQEQHRPQLHFSPPTQWMNDPNGMVFFDDEYHLFYQYYPDSTVWGPMHWGHAVSKDLTHWEHLPIAIAPDEKGYIFSGSAVVDWDNTSGFSKDGEPPLVAIFTYHDPEGEKSGAIDFQSQAIAYSNDRGRTWTKYENNPVVPNPGIRDFRDPKVIWDADNDQWVMVLAAQDQVMFYTSKDLKAWRYLSQFGKNRGAHGGVWECPDLFPVTISGTGARKWVLLVSINPGGPNGGSATQYFIGDFDGLRFRLDPEFGAEMARQAKKDSTGVAASWVDYGRDNYAGVTWSDLPQEDASRIFMGWMSNWDYAQVVPTALWRSAMTLPRQFQVKETAMGPRLFQNFVEELRTLRGEQHEVDITASPGNPQDLGVSPQQLEIILEVATSNTGSFGFELSNSKGEVYRVGYDADAKAYFSDRTKSGKLDFSEKFAPSIHYAPKQLEGVLVNMHLIFDVSSVELIADDGLTAITDVFFPSEDFTMIRFFKEEEGMGIQRLEVYPLEGIW
ncbi:glycoside hydrolase family 32 protein [Lewinella sp. LCG006]|uniref:glycoside hydrolase family 32 protein n=1 Tax=Lewinella sp. LCG006 TaxID=3231911 RepID=UPI00345F6AA2